MKIFIFCAIVALTSALPVIDDKVYEELSANGTTTVILHFGGPEHSDLLAKYQRDHRPLERTVHQDVLPNMLEANANKHQNETLEFLRGRKLARSSGSDYTQIWMVNQLVIHNADLALIEEFKKSNEITKVEADRIIPIVEKPSFYLRKGKPKPKPKPKNSTIGQNKVQWGIKDVGAPEVWAKGNRGQGVVVGVLDTGIRASHEILRSRFRSSYAWLDPIDKKVDPYDDHGHGTHCAGSIAGTNGYGVAPEATLIACKGCSVKRGCPSSAILTCGQFMLCPTNTAGKNKDCTKAPKIVSNSWGSPGYATTYHKTIDTWIQAGMIVIVGNGNEGPECGSTYSPASYEKSIAVGAITIQNKMADFSGRGPVQETTSIKPDISAPGEDIMSASHLSDTRYVSRSGTSMAAPHVSGIAALYAKANPKITQDQVMAKLREGAQPVTATGEQCGDIPDSEYPNNAAGAGKVYAPAGF